MVVSYGIDSNNNCATLENFRSNQPKQTAPQQQPIKTAPMDADKVEVKTSAEQTNTVQPDIADKPKKKKTSLIQGFKNIVAGIKKFFVASWEYSKGIGRGLYYGTIAAVGVLGVDAALGVAKKAYQSRKSAEIAEGVAEGLPKTAKKAFKMFSTKGKVLASLAMAASVGYQLFKSSLDVNEKNAAIDHRWGSGHDRVD